MQLLERYEIARVAGGDCEDTYSVGADSANGDATVVAAATVTNGGSNVGCENAVNSAIAAAIAATATCSIAPLTGLGVLACAVAVNNAVTAAENAINACPAPAAINCTVDSMGNPINCNVAEGSVEGGAEGGFAGAESGGEGGIGAMGGEGGIGAMGGEGGGC